MSTASSEGRSGTSGAQQHRVETNPPGGFGAGAVVAPWLSERSALLGICLRWTRGNLAEAEDLLGDACLRILEGDERGSAEVDRPLAFWATVINNLGRDRSRRSRRWNFYYQGPGAELLGALPARTISAEQQVLLRECLTATDRRLARLSERQRTAVLLRSAGIDYSEIADALSTSSANARKIVAAARVALRLSSASVVSCKVSPRRVSHSRACLQPSYRVES